MALTVKDLKDILSNLPEEMELIEIRYSDYESMRPELWEVVKGVDNNGQYIMSSHETMSEAHKAREKEYLLFKGN